MNVIEIVDIEDYTAFDLELEDAITCRIIIATMFHSKTLQWNFHVERNKRNSIRIKNKKFVFCGTNEVFTEQEEKQINEGFYEILRQVKNHPSYRLKVIHILNEDIRRIWNNI